MIGAVVTRILLGLYEEIRELVQAGSAPEAITAALRLTIKAAAAGRTAYAIQLRAFALELTTPPETAPASP